ncbi:MATE family efflux transporter [Pseudoflavonifractor phocaeensis]|uniref:MATE family efflux transporter n=1 Tax=Pseudoflavonifractor phocaeensis TaxID=1870988 RepID=UPI00195E3685|nr:MATE family efflux transporter [Pseudoflavonifractor phocaeensis]
MTTVFEEKNVSKAIMRVGLPAMLGQLTTLIYNIADTFFVSLTKEPAMIAAVTLCTPILLIIMSISSIFGMGGNSVIARLLGENDNKRVSRTLNFCMYAMAIAGIVILLAGVIFMQPIAKLSGADGENMAYTCDYLKYIFLGAPFIIISNGAVHLFRSIGFIKESTIGLALGNSINIVFDFIFIVLWGWGTAGAALATSFGFFCSTVYYLICMIRAENMGNQLIKLSPRQFAPNKGMVFGVVSIGIPGALITVLLSVSNIVLNNFIGIYGSDAVAAYGIAYKIDMVPIMLSVGLSQGVAPLVGYYFGAGQRERMSRIMRTATLYGILLGAVFLAAFWLLGTQLAGIFLHDEPLIEEAGHFIAVLGLSAPMLGIINMVTSYFQALGAALKSLVITVMRNAVLFIPAVILLNSLWKLNGVIAAQPIVETVLALVCLLMYAKDCAANKAALVHQS